MPLTIDDVGAAAARINAEYHDEPLSVYEDRGEILRDLFGRSNGGGTPTGEASHLTPHIGPASEPLCWVRVSRHAQCGTAVTTACTPEQLEIGLRWWLDPQPTGAGSTVAARSAMRGV